MYNDFLGGLVVMFRITYRIIETNIKTPKRKKRMAIKTTKHDSHYTRCDLVYDDEHTPYEDDH
jgi:hypothetical protein